MEMLKTRPVKIAEWLPFNGIQWTAGKTTTRSQEGLRFAEKFEAYNPERSSQCANSTVSVV